MLGTSRRLHKVQLAQQAAPAMRTTAGMQMECYDHILCVIMHYLCHVHWLISMRQWLTSRHKLE